MNSNQYLTIKVDDLVQVNPNKVGGTSYEKYSNMVFRVIKVKDNGPIQEAPLVYLDAKNTDGTYIAMFDWRLQKVFTC